MSIESTYTFTMLSQIGQTPLHIAAGSGNYEIVKLLVNANSDVNATPKVHCEHHYLLYYSAMIIVGLNFIHGLSLPCGGSTRNTCIRSENFLKCQEFLMNSCQNIFVM